MRKSQRACFGSAAARTASSLARMYQNAPIASITIAAPQPHANRMRPIRRSETTTGGSIQKRIGRRSVSHRGPQLAPPVQSAFA